VGPSGVGQNEERVVVAICPDGAQGEAIAAGLAFSPEAVLGPAEEGHEAAVQRRRERVATHVAEHQDLGGSGILDDGGEQSVHLVPGKTV
jgi:hypothetical protein